MKLFIDNYGENNLGGGFSFRRNFMKGMSQIGHEFVNSIEESDLLMICGITMTPMSSIMKAKSLGKKIVLRVDNVPRKSRNRRSTPHERLKEVAEISDLVVYQSKWSKEYAGILCGEGVVIYNGVDTDVFNKGNREYSDHRYLFVQYNRDENKRYEEARYFFQLYHRQKKGLILNLVGNFSPELVQSNFDFWNGEKIDYHGILNEVGMAEIMKKSDFLLYPSFADSCPNTVLEAMACGCQILLVNPIGGTQELTTIPSTTTGSMPYAISIKEMCSWYNHYFREICKK